MNKKFELQLLYVHYEDQLVGQLELNAQGQLELTYAETWRQGPGAFPISLSLPLSGAYTAQAAHSFFVNLLPEESVRQRICMALKISPGNDYELLKAIGGDCAGALAVTTTRHPPTSGDDYEPLSDQQLADWSMGTPDAFSAITGQNDVRLSLAGAQDKLPIHLIDGRYFVPHGNAPSTYLLKFPSPYYSHLPENETFVSLVGRQLRLPVVEIRLIATARNRIALIKRYDRLSNGTRSIRVHQEDFCQALGVSPRQKYQKEGGPSLLQCATVIREHCTFPALELRKLLDWVWFNLLIGNADAHGKNLSLLYTSTGRRELAPFYDLVCTRNYPRIDRHLAMSVGDRTDPGQIGVTQLHKLAEDLQVGFRLVREAGAGLIEGLAKALPLAHQEFLADFGPSPILDRITLLANKQLKRMSRELRQTKSVDKA